VTLRRGDWEFVEAKDRQHCENSAIPTREEARMTGDCPATRPGFRRPLLLRRSSLPRRARNNTAGLLISTLLAAVLTIGVSGVARAGGPQGQLTWGIHVTLAPTWFDPAETQGIITPYMVLYALHDALVKPMPGQALAPSLAESWSASEDALTYEFVLRNGVKFHNGDPVTAEDVKFSFERYRGAANKLLKERVAAIETPDARHVRFRLKEPWPDFLTYYVGATGAGWIVPKKYVEQVGEEGYKKAPVGAGPYKFVSFTPGQALVLDAFDEYWRKTPNVRRLVFRVIPDESTRLAALKRGEIDIAYSIRGELAEEIQHTKGLTLKAAVTLATFFLYFADQWDAKSPWHDVRVRRAANLALDLNTINEALTLGYSRLTNSIIPASFDFYWAPPAAIYDPAKARALLAEAGYPAGFDAGELFCDGAYANLAEAAINNLEAVGIRIKLRPLERAAYYKAYGEKTFKNVIQGSSGAFGNAATRIQAFVAKGGAFAYGNDPEIDALFAQQAPELDQPRRGATLGKIQQLMHERAMFAPLWQLAFLNGVGPRVKEPGFGLIANYPYSAPYEDVSLTDK
jgi:peptide/nickel transport system substrate-binding protein